MVFYKGFYKETGEAATFVQVYDIWDRVDNTCTKHFPSLVRAQP